MKWPFGRRDEVGRIEEDLAGSVVLRAGAGQRIRAEGDLPFRSMIVPYEIIERDSLSARKD